jgi:hypothetical protein
LGQFGDFTKSAFRDSQMPHMHFLVDIATLIPQYLGCRRAGPLEVGLLKAQGSKSGKEDESHMATKKKAKKKAKKK